jgi:hypothetical protein
LFRADMTFPIDFHDQFRFVAKEIDDISSHRVLSAELKSAEPSMAKCAPQQPFRNG